ncbi:MAG: alpha/beta hydrolase fold domain-containing protein [FCB group bacterium]|nr:alpha/beta hydrolase fold domain-containing protein [FCB group bacterium]MBL7120383.1 alpha/beta hydrolase fold domain-containing protein [Candidatus Neomarinimicrobiota bacterium]
MMRIFQTTLFIVLGAIQLLAVQKSQDTLALIYTRGGGFKADKIVKYKTIGENDLSLYCFYPDDFNPGDSRPAIVFFFGGGWKGGSVQQFFPQSKYLASRGMIAICAQYRTAKQGAEPYECVEDGKSAIRYVRGHARELGINPQLIAAGGGSAGGHLAACTATISDYDCPEDDRSISAIPNALVLFSPVYDNGPQGYGYERVKDYYLSISPIDNLNGKQPPTLVFMGDRDKHTPVETTQRYQQSMLANGNHCQTIIYPGQKHGFFNIHKSKQPKYFIETAVKMDGFLKTLGFISGPATIHEWFKDQEGTE